MGVKLTAKDVRDVSGYGKEELRALLKLLGRPAEARKARPYTRLDLTVFCVIGMLEVRFGMRRAEASKLFGQVRAALSVPRNPNRKAKLIVTLSPPTAVYVDVVNSVEEGLVVALELVFDKVDTFFGGYAEAAPSQGALALPAVVVPGKKRSRTTA